MQFTAGGVLEGDGRMPVAIFLHKEWRQAIV